MMKRFGNICARKYACEFMDISNAAAASISFLMPFSASAGHAALLVKFSCRLVGYRSTK